MAFFWQKLYAINYVEEPPPQGRGFVKKFNGGGKILAPFLLYSHFHKSKKGVYYG
jgi:hypothetical protein